MRVVHVAPVWLPVSAASHGGIETFLAGLVTAQQELGHDVTLVAAGTSEVGAVPVVPAVPTDLVTVMERGEAGEYGYYEQELLAAALGAAGDADVVHSHVVPAGFVLDAALAGRVPVLHTLHGQVTADLVWALRRSPHHVVAVSRSQQAEAEAAGARLLGVTGNGIDMRGASFSAEPGEGLLFLGRMEAQKGPDTAIATARALGLPLTLAGPVTDRGFFDTRVVPQLGDGVRYVGVLAGQAKQDALAGSACLLAPSRWSEPFGMVAVEAMACGTPVAALARGALPEVVEDGVTGRVVAGEAELAQAVREAVRLDRQQVRDRAWSRFHIGSVAQRYLDRYAELQRPAPAAAS